jgi:hypothetical protein
LGKGRPRLVGDVGRRPVGTSPGVPVLLEF